MRPDPAIAPARGWRILVWCLLVAGWLFMLLHLWDAFAAFPSAERLEHSRTVAIPTLQTLGLLALRSTLELAAVLVLTWPWWDRRWIARVWTTALLVTAWFIITAPLTLSRMMWVHRRWLVAMALGLALAGAVAGVSRMVRGWRARGGARTDTPRPR
jgi:hypothetical protein